MAAKLTFKYDREADILHIDKCAPYAEQESEELGDEVIARLNPTTGEVENVEVLFFSTRLLRSDLFELPVTADLRGVIGLRDCTSSGRTEINRVALKSEADYLFADAAGNFYGTTYRGGRECRPGRSCVITPRGRSWAAGPSRRT
jgi:uncharacterized protein YuzE